MGYESNGDERCIMAECDETPNGGKLVKWAMFRRVTLSLNRKTGRWGIYTAFHGEFIVGSDLGNVFTWHSGGWEWLTGTCSIYYIREPVEKLPSFKKCFRLRISDIINWVVSYRMSESNALYLDGLSPRCWTRTDFPMIHQFWGSRKHSRKDSSSSPQTEFLTTTHFYQKGSASGHFPWK